MFNRDTLEKLKNDIVPVSHGHYEAVEKRWNSIAKPVHGLGELERLVARLGSVMHTDRPCIDPAKLLLFISDNGIVEEGVSQCGSEVTRNVAEAVASGSSTSSVMAGSAGVEVIGVDIGMIGEKIPDLRDRRIREGTRDFLKEPAMTENETLAAIEAGFIEAKAAIDNGAKILLLGEMGIGNTSTSTAVSCALLSLDPDEMTGYGAGLSEEGRKRKGAVISSALKKHSVDPEDPLKVLMTFGGYDIAGMVGTILRSASLKTPVILDGLITLSAALVSERLFPGIRDHLIASIIPREPMGKAILNELGLIGVIDADISLGEGTGALLLKPLLDMSIDLYNKGRSFNESGIDPYEVWRK